MKDRNRGIRLGAHLFLLFGLVFTGVFIFNLWKSDWYWAVVFFVVMSMTLMTAFLGYHFLRLIARQKPQNNSQLLVLTTMAVGKRVDAAFSLPVNREARRRNRKL